MVKPSPIFVFDAFGTLFDVHSAARDHADALGPNAARVSDVWRAKQLEYTWIYAGLGESLPFREITRLSLDYALNVCGLEQTHSPRWLESYQRLKPFGEVPLVLQRLRARGTKLAILSNADPDMLDDLVRNAGLEQVFDQLISARTAGTFKPAPPVYALASEAFGCLPSDLTFVSSNRWDVAGAKAFGFETVWVNRALLPDEYPDMTADRTIPDLEGLLS